MLKKIIKWVAILSISLFLLVALSYFIFVNWFAKDFIESQIEKQVNRDVEIGELFLNIFNVEPAIKIQNLIVFNQVLTEKNQSKNKETFVSIESIQLLLKLKPLIKGQFQLDALLVKSPDIRIVRYANGKFNFSDLIESKEASEKKSSPKNQTEQTKTTETTSETHEKPKKPESTEKQDKPKQFCADDLPVQILVGKLGIENAHIQLFDQQYQQIIHMNKLDVLLKDININPKNLEKENQILFDTNMNIKTEGKIKTGWAKSFDVDIMCEAKIHPFNAKTRLLDPQATIKAGSPSGIVSGLQVYDMIRSKLKNFKLTSLDFLKDDLRWKKGVVNLIANQDQIQLNEGNFQVEDLAIYLDGKYMIKTKSLDIATDILLSDEEQQKIESAVKTFINKQISYQHRRYVNIDEISKSILDAIIAKDGHIHFIFAISGPVKKPDVRVIQPQLPSIDSIVTDTLKNIKSQLLHQAKKKANEEVNRVRKKAKKEVDRIKQKAERELDRLPESEGKNILKGIKDKVLDNLPFSF
jgi:ElaB/YqjD/DUF883 family membrane-anchored ribosome-binding protein